MAGLETRIGHVKMLTPLMFVSGIFGKEYHELPKFLEGVGAVVTKSITLHPRPGNPEPRMVATPAGLLNSIGLENSGLKDFISNVLPRFLVLEVPIIASVAGERVKEYVECSSALAAREEIDAIELNVSCPNVGRGGMQFGCDPEALEGLVSNVRRVTGNRTLIVKLTPNVADIALPTAAAIDGGADAISLINTVRGMAINLTPPWRPRLGNGVGGLSGQCIHPIAVYMVSRCFAVTQKKKRIPIIGIGGVTSGEEALELILAGAASVGIGTGAFRGAYKPTGSRGSEASIFEAIKTDLLEYLARQDVKRKGVASISDLVGRREKVLGEDET